MAPWGIPQSCAPITRLVSALTGFVGWELVRQTFASDHSLAHETRRSVAFAGDDGLNVVAVEDMRASGNGRTIQSIEANGTSLYVAQRDIIRCLEDPTQLWAWAHWLRDLAVRARCSIDGELKIGGGKVFTDALNCGQSISGNSRDRRQLTGSRKE